MRHELTEVRHDRTRTLAETEYACPCGGRVTVAKPLPPYKWSAGQGVEVEGDCPACAEKAWAARLSLSAL